MNDTSEIKIREHLADKDLNALLYVLNEASYYSTAEKSNIVSLRALDPLFALVSLLDNANKSLKQYISTLEDK
jgi:hypothetical protein